MALSRRAFITSSAATTASISLSNFELSKNLPIAKKGFDIKYYATRWGYKESLDHFCRNVKEAGYDGIEDWLPIDKSKADTFVNTLTKHGLSFASLAGSNGPDFKTHLSTYSNNLDFVLSYHPVFINCHTGRDYFLEEQKHEFLQIGINKSKTAGIPIYQETHRSRIFYAAHQTLPLLKSNTEVGLTLDISHWCNVAESLLADQEKTIDEVLKYVHHIHARVGHAEGPQVPDPWAPEWNKATEAHFRWWDKIVAKKRKAGEVLTMTPEFGPANYMWTLPYTYQPVANQWEINKKMLEVWKKRYS